MKNFFLLFIIVVLVVLLINIQQNIEKSFNYPFKPVTTLQIKEATFVNFWGVLLGLRRLSADLAWIDVLQYYGTHFEEDEHEDGKHHHEGHRHIQWGEYKELLSHCQVVIRLDPYFKYAYLYGAGALAFNHERFDQAIELLEEGVANNPEYWRFHLYLGAIVARQKGEYQKVIPLLEQVVFAPETPMMLRSILAQIYEKQGNYHKARLVWEYILSTATEEHYIKRAKSHLEKLNNI